MNGWGRTAHRVAEIRPAGTIRIMEGRQNPAAVIEARGLTKRYGDLTAVDAIDFEVARGGVRRLPRPQRRREDDHRPDGLLLLPDHRGDASGSSAST